VLRKIFEPKRDGVKGDWGKLHNEELHAVYASPRIIPVITSRIIKWVGHVACMVERRYAERALVGQSDGKRSLERRTPRWEYDIKVDQIKSVGMVRAGLFSLWIDTSGGLL
jgi:hypothetical protein